MPWEHCEEKKIPDNSACPTCGLSKAEWTVEIGKTRTILVSRTRPAAAARVAWLEIQLVDTKHKRPIPDVDYKIGLPSSRFAKGTLDADGRVRLEGLPAGTCLISFPGLMEVGVERETCASHVIELEKAWDQRQATSCGAYALAHALRLAAGTLDANQDGTIQQAEWEAVHREAKQIWEGVQFEQPDTAMPRALSILKEVLVQHKYSSPARIAVHSGDSDRLDGFFLAGGLEGDEGMKKWSETRSASGMPMSQLLNIVLGEAADYGLSIHSGDGLDRIMGQNKFAIVPCDARTYLHYVMFRDIDGKLSVYDSQSTSYEWKALDKKPERGDEFETPGTALKLVYLGMSVVVSGDAVAADR